MTSEVPADHKRFSAEFFNRTWDLLETPNRTADEDEQMVSLSHASLAHWRLRPDCTARNLSIGYWQLARVYAVLNQPTNARHYGLLCLAASQNESAFYRAYAHEALARAARQAGDSTALADHLAAAQLLAEQVSEANEKELIDSDLNQLRE